MILTVIDPALLTYNCEDLNTGESYCVERLEALTVHREAIRKYNLRIAVSEIFADFILSLFPWKESGNNMLHDLREFILVDLQRAYYVGADEVKEVEIAPEGILCQYVECKELISAWGQVLVGCVGESSLTKCKCNIATWCCQSIVSQIDLVIVERIYSRTDKARHKYYIQLVWDEDSWANQLVNEDWWPDLALMVELTFVTNKAIRNNVKVRASPINFACSKGFWDSADKFCCDNDTRRSFIKALTKIVYGLRDKGLGLEIIKSQPGVYRFRVTGSARVHCHMESERLIIDEIGPHRTDGVG